MPEPFDVPTFSLKERDRRLDIANRLMDAEGLDALIIYGDREGAFPGSFAPDTYFTNERPGAIVVLPKGGVPRSIVMLPTVIEDHIQERYVGRYGWIEPQNMYVGKMGANIVEIVEDLGLDKARFGIVGLEPWPPFYFDGAMPYNTFATLQEDLPEASFTPIGNAFFKMTAARSAEEIAVLKWSAEIGEKISEAMRAATRPGVRESDIYAAGMAESARLGGFATAILLGSGPEFVGWGLPTWTYRPEAPRLIEEGDIVLAEVFSSVGMLETQHQPAIAVGDIHPDFHVAAQAARASYLAGVSALKAGHTFGEVVEAMNAPMRAADAWHVHPLVHSINPFGLIGVGDRMADLPEAKTYGKIFNIPSMGLETVLEEGMSFAFEPNAAIGRKVVNLGGTVLVGKKAGIELNANTTRLMHAG